MSDASFEFTTDPAKAQQLAAERKQALNTAKSSMAQEHRTLSEMDLLHQGILQTRQKMQARSLRNMQSVMEEGRRARLHRSIAAGGAASPYRGDLNVEGGAYGGTALPSASWQYHRNAEAPPRAATGLEKLEAVLPATTTALGLLTTAALTAGQAMRGAVDIKKTGYEERGTLRTAVRRAATEMHVNPWALLGMVTESPDRGGALSFLEQVTARSQMGGPRPNARQLASAFGGVRRGAYDWSTMSGLAQQNRYGTANRPGFVDGGFESRYLDVMSGKNTADWDAVGRGAGSGENAEFYDPAWKAFQQEHPLLASGPGAEYLRTLRTTYDARGERADYTNPDNIRRSYDVTVQPGTQQSPIVGGGIDTQSGGRGVAATNAAIHAVSSAIKTAIGSRTPNPHGTGTQP